MAEKHQMPCESQPHNETSNENKSPWAQVLAKYAELDARLTRLEEAALNDPQHS